MYNKAGKQNATQVSMATWVNSSVVCYSVRCCYSIDYTQTHTAN